MKKNAFTFVELAIIDIIMGMAIKGRELINTVKIRADMKDTQKIESAVAIMAAKTDTYGGTGNLPKAEQPKQAGFCGCGAPESECVRPWNVSGHMGTG